MVVKCGAWQAVGVAWLILGPFAFLVFSGYRVHTLVKGSQTLKFGLAPRHGSKEMFEKLQSTPGLVAKVQRAARAQHAHWHERSSVPCWLVSCYWSHISDSTRCNTRYGSIFRALYVDGSILRALSQHRLRSASWDLRIAGHSSLILRDQRSNISLLQSKTYITRSDTIPPRTGCAVLRVLHGYQICRRMGEVGLPVSVLGLAHGVSVRSVFVCMGVCMSVCMFVCLLKCLARCPLAL